MRERVGLIPGHSAYIINFVMPGMPVQIKLVFCKTIKRVQHMSVCQKVLRLMYLFKYCEEPKGTDELAILLCMGNPT
jgi:hypothetical protein